MDGPGHPLDNGAGLVADGVDSGPKGGPGLPLAEQGVVSSMEARGQPTGRVAVIMPTYNERANIESTAGRVRRAVPDADLLVVDDNSPDGTGETADKLAAG